MGKDELQAGPELDALVAEKVMGWGKPDLPAFSVRIQDALLVEDEMERRGFWMSSPHL